MLLSLSLSSEPRRRSLGTVAQLRAELSEGYANLVTALSVGAGFVVIDTAFDWMPAVLSDKESLSAAASYYTSILNTPQVVLVTMWMVYMYLLRVEQVRGGLRRILSCAADWPTAPKEVVATETSKASSTLKVTTVDGRAKFFVLTPWLRRELARLHQVERVVHFCLGVYIFVVVPNYLRLQYSIEEDLATRLSLWPVVLVSRLVLLSGCWFSVRECRIGLTQLSMDGDAR